MSMKKKDIADAPIFSEKKIKQITKLLQDKVAEHMRLQSEGKLPYRSRMPVIVIEIYHIKEILGVSRSTAQRVMAEVRMKVNKTNGEYISVQDFIDGTGLPQRDVQRSLDLLT